MGTRPRARVWYMATVSETVLVVGAGIAGLSMSIALAERGIECEILERSPEARAHGSGLFTCANGLAALDRLGAGVGALVRERGVAIRQRRIETARGREMAVVEERDIWGGDWYSLGITRQALHEVLQEAAGSRSTQFGFTITALRTTPTGVEVTRSDGREQVYAAVVGADGVRSSVRRLLLGAPATRTVSERAVRWIARRPPGVDAWTMRASSIATLVMIPVSEDEVYCYAHRRQALPEASVEEWLEPFRNFAEPVPEVLGARTTEVFEDRIEELAVPDVWGDGRVMLIGDAVHAMPPYMAQGGSLAIEDAEAAAAVLAEGDFEQAATRLSTSRATRTKWVQERSRRREKLSKLPFLVAQLGLRFGGRKSFIADLAPLSPHVEG